MKLYPYCGTVEEPLVNHQVEYLLSRPKYSLDDLGDCISSPDFQYTKKSSLRFFLWLAKIFKLPLKGLIFNMFEINTATHFMPKNSGQILKAIAEKDRKILAESSGNSNLFVLYLSQAEIWVVLPQAYLAANKYNTQIKIFGHWRPLFNV